MLNRVPKTFTAAKNTAFTEKLFRKLWQPKITKQMNGTPNK